MLTLIGSTDSECLIFTSRLFKRILFSCQNMFSLALFKLFRCHAQMAEASFLPLFFLFERQTACCGHLESKNKGEGKDKGTTRIGRAWFGAEKYTSLGRKRGLGRTNIFHRRKSASIARPTLTSYFSLDNPSHLRPVILKPVGRIFKISDSNLIQGKCGRPSHHRKTRV